GRGAGAATALWDDAGAGEGRRDEDRRIARKGPASHSVVVACSTRRGPQTAADENRRKSRLALHRARAAFTVLREDAPLDTSSFIQNEAEMEQSLRGSTAGDVVLLVQQSRRLGS